MILLDNVLKLVDMTDLARLKKTEELRRNDMEGAKGSVRFGFLNLKQPKILKSFSKKISES